MVIRTREDALKALSEVLSLDRRSQIVQITVRLAQCLSPEARQVLFRAQEGLVQGKLELKLKERQGARAQAASGAAEPEPPPGPITDGKILDELVTAMEALKMAAVAMDVFPQLGRFFARWEVARALLYFNDQIRQIISEGTHPQKSEAAFQQLSTIVSRFRPWWHSQVPMIAEACTAVIQRAPRSRWPIGARSLLDIVASTELRAMYALKDTIPNQAAMIEPLTKIWAQLQRLLAQAYPQGLPEESALID